MSNRLEDNDNQSTTTATTFNRSVYQQQLPVPQAQQNALMQAQMQQMQQFQNPYAYQYDWYNWNAQMYGAQMYAEMAYRDEMARKLQYQQMYGGSQLNSTMIDPQKQQQTPAPQPAIGIPSQLPPPTAPFYNPYDPYAAAYGLPPPSMYTLPPAALMPPSAYSLPPPTPRLVDMSQQQQLQAAEQQNEKPALSHHEQQRQLAQTPSQKFRNISTSSFKQEETFEMIDGKVLVNHNEDIVEPKRERLTPMIHQRPHVKAIFGLNTVIQIKANDPCEGQPALVEIHNLYDLIEDYLTSNPSYKLMQEFPGPLIKDSTPKATIIQFCQKKVKECLNNTLLNDSQSYALLWEYLALLVRQNGIVDLKTDISSLLLGETQNWALESTNKASGTPSLAPTPAPMLHDDPPERSNTPNSEIANITDGLASINVNNHQHTAKRSYSEDEITVRLRQLLASGQRLDAIDWAVKHGQWSHALFIAITQQPQIDAKLIQKLKMKFINSLQNQDPLKTCYQLYCGRLPTVTTLSNTQSEWNDWRRHLAMIVSNQDLYNKDLVVSSIKTMGDSLATNNRVAASHFCYLLANVHFGDYRKKSSKIVLIGSSHNQEFSKFCQLSAIQATEIYEFATQTVLDNFLQFKLIYAMRLTEYGLTSEAYKYLEVIARSINSNPTLHSDKISSAFHLADRLKQQDTDFVMNNSVDSSEANEPQWLNQLRANFQTLFFNTPQQTDMETAATTSNNIAPHTPASSTNEEFVFKQPSEPAPSNKRKYQNQTHYTDQIYANPPAKQLNGGGQQPRKQSFDFSNSNETPALYQLPAASASDYTIGQQQPQEQYLMPAQPQQHQALPTASNSMPSLNQIDYPTLPVENNYAPSSYDNTTNQMTHQHQQQQEYSYQQQQPQQEQQNEPPVQMYQLPTAPVNDFSMPFNAYQQQPQQQFSPEDGHSQQHHNNNNNFDDDDLYNKKPQQSNGFAKSADNGGKASEERTGVKSEPVDEDKASKSQQQLEESTGFLGRIFGRISSAPKAPKAKVAVLPNDKKKTIVWDDKKQKYVNLAEPEAEETKIKPPPTMPSLVAPAPQPTVAQPQPQQQQPPAPASTNNMYSLKNVGRTNYYAKLDVMSGTTKKVDNTDIKPLLSNVAPPAQLPQNFFIPQAGGENFQQQSQSGTPTGGMQFFNPANYSNQNTMQQPQAQ